MDSLQSSFRDLEKAISKTDKDPTWITITVPPMVIVIIVNFLITYILGDFQRISIENKISKENKIVKSNISQDFYKESLKKEILISSIKSECYNETSKIKNAISYNDCKIKMIESVNRIPASTRSVCKKVFN